MSPFKTKKQRKWMYANKPELAKRWTAKYGKTVKKKKRNGSR